MSQDAYPEFARLMSIVAALRDPEGGCPWDLRQTHVSLLKYLIEESYELRHAIEQGDDGHIREELGDVLLQVLLHSQIASEDARFDLEGVAQTLADKLIRRHPHVFAERPDQISEAQLHENWEKVKAQEKEDKGGADGYLDDALLHFPGLMSSFKIGKKCHAIGFDWSNSDEVMKVVVEEWHELIAEIFQKPQEERNPARVQEEFGDLLFALAQLGRHLQVDPEEAVRQANHKFMRRFREMERMFQDKGDAIEGRSPDELEDAWQAVKRGEKHPPS